MKTTHLLGALLFFALLSGCRTYGGHGSDESIYHQILAAIDELESETNQFETRLGGFSNQLTVDEHDRIASSRAQLVQEYREIADRLSPRSGNRELRRVYGSIISDRQILNDMLERIEDASDVADDGESPMRIADPRAQYHVVPVYYHRLGLDRGAQIGPAADVDTSASAIEVPTSPVEDMDDENVDDENVDDASPESD